MQRLESINNNINGWYCNIHNLYNDILTERCKYCDELRDESLAVLATHTKWTRTGWLTEAKELRMAETERELHAEFFTQWDSDEAMAIADMNDEQALTERQQKYARIILEGKVRHTRVSEKIRQLKAAKGGETRKWLIPTDAEDTIKQVQQRQGRMTKLDKINESLLELMSPEDAAALMNGNIKKTTDTKLGVFKIVKTSQPEKVEPKNDEPFDFTKLGKD